MPDKTPPVSSVSWLRNSPSPGAVTSKMTPKHFQPVTYPAWGNSIYLVPPLPISSLYQFISRTLFSSGNSSTSKLPPVPYPKSSARHLRPFLCGPNLPFQPTSKKRPKAPHSSTPLFKPSPSPETPSLLCLVGNT